MPPKPQREDGNGQRNRKKKNKSRKSKKKAKTGSKGAVCESDNENSDGDALKQPQIDNKKSTDDGTDMHTPEQSSNGSSRDSDNTDLEQKDKPKGQDAEKMQSSKEAASAEGDKPGLEQKDKPKGQDAEKMNLNENDSNGDTHEKEQSSKEASAEDKTPHLDHKDNSEDQDAINMNVNGNDSSRDAHEKEQSGKGTCAHLNTTGFILQKENLGGEDPSNINSKKRHLNKDELEKSSNQTSSDTKTSVPIKNAQKGNSETGDLTFNEFDKNLHQQKPSMNRASRDSDDTDSLPAYKTDNQVIKKIDTEETDSRKETHEQMQPRNGTSVESNIAGVIGHSSNPKFVQGDKTDIHDTNEISTNEILPSSETQETEQHGNEASADAYITGFLKDSDNDSVYGDKTDSQETKDISNNESLPSSETQERAQHENGASADADITVFLEYSDKNDSVDGNKTSSQETITININESLPSSETQKTEQHGNGTSEDVDKTGSLEDSENNDSIEVDKTGSQETITINTNESLPSSETQETERENEASADDDKTVILEDSHNNDFVDADKTESQDTNNISAIKSPPSKEIQEENQHGNGPSAIVDESSFLEDSGNTDSEHGDKVEHQSVKEIKSNENNSMNTAQKSERLKNGALGDSDKMDFGLKMNYFEDQDGKYMNLDESHQSEKTREPEHDPDDIKIIISIENGKTGNHDTQALISNESEKVEVGEGEDNSQNFETGDKMEVCREETSLPNDEERIARSEEEIDKKSILSRSDQGNITTEDSLSQERIDGEDRLKDAQQMTEELLKHQSSEKEQLHAKLAEANEEIENLRQQVEEQSDSLSQERINEEERLWDAQQMREELLKYQTTEEELLANLAEAIEEIENLRQQVEEQSDSLSQERINGEERLQDAQQMKEELLKHQTTEEELLAKLAAANEEIENLRRQVEEQSGMRYHVPNQETDRLPHDKTMSGSTPGTNNLQDREDIESTSYERKIKDLENELHSQQERVNDNEAQIEQLNKTINDKSDENCRLLQRILELEIAEKQLNEIKTKASEEESLREAEIEKLQKELDSMNESLNQERNIGEDRLKEIEKLEEDVHNYRTREEDYQQKLEEANREMENLKRQTEKQCADNGGILHKYLEEEKTSKNYKVSLEIMGQEKEELESQLHYTKEKLAQTEREVIITKEEHKAEKSKLEETFQRLKAQSSQEIEKQYQQINNLKDDIRRLETIFAHTTNELEGKKVENKKLESELNRIKRELEGIKNEKTQLEDLVCQLNGEINTRDTRIMKMNGDLTMKEAEKTYANECMQKAVQRQQEMAYQLSTLQRVEMEKNQAEQDKKTLLDENNLLRASLRETDDFRSYLQNYYKILQDTQLALQRETDKNRHFNELLSSNGHRMENMTADLRNYRSLAESHRKSLEEKKDYVHGLQRNIDKLTYENEKLKEERDRYHQESFELKDRCQGLTEELEQSRNESRELREQAEAADGTSENRSFPNQGQFPNPFTSTPAGPPNVNFQGPGFFAHGTGISGSRRN